MDINKFYHFDYRTKACNKKLTDSLVNLFLNDDKLVSLLFHRENGVIVNDLDLHINQKGMSSEMLDVLHAIQKEIPYIRGVYGSNPDEVDDIVYNSIISRYDTIGAYLTERLEEISSTLKDDKDDNVDNPTSSSLDSPDVTSLPNNE